jgi:hypothetical protein
MCKITTWHHNFTIQKTSNIFQVFFRSDESNCRKIEGGAKLYDQGLLKKCYFDRYDKNFTQNNNVSRYNQKNGFECGEFHCLPIESFCGTKPDFGSFRPERICPGFHILNFN